MRLGRDYVPSFLNLPVFDPFATLAAGDYMHSNLGVSRRADAAVTLTRCGRAYRPRGSIHTVFFSS
jgi:hypothetical protein